MPPPALPLCRITPDSTQDKARHMFLLSLLCKNIKPLKDASVVDISMSENNYQLYLFVTLLSHLGLDNLADTLCSGNNQGRETMQFIDKAQSPTGSA